MMKLDELKDLYQQSEKQALEDFYRFLSFPSISSEAAYAPDVRACAAWLEKEMVDLGLKTQVFETSGHPILLGEDLSAGTDKPTLLIYNHYDVQPVDPLELWETPPFSPSLRNGQIYARGAQDNKGQCFYVMQALKLLKSQGQKFPINIKWIIEGEEETGSEGLAALLPKMHKTLKADYVAIVDLGIPGLNAPAITLGTRGILTLDITLTSSRTDLHSGTHGGLALNPIHALIRLLAGCRDVNGKVTIPGFYDSIIPIEPSEKERLYLDFDEAAYAKIFGAYPGGGEKEFSPFERAWTRPTLEVNGIKGGYTGDGFKTVIPAQASAKVSCRLVPGQDPKQIGLLVARYLEENTPKGITLSVDLHPGSGPACRSDFQSKGVQAFSKAYAEVFEKPIRYTFEGGSIPIINELAQASGAEPVLLGLGLIDDHIHAPNEHFGIDRLEKGALIMALGIQQLAIET